MITEFLKEKDTLRFYDLNQWPISNPVLKVDKILEEITRL